MKDFDDNDDDNNIIARYNHTHRRRTL